MTPTMNVQVAHQVPGRIRLKVPNVKDNPELIDQIKQMFHVIPGIEEVTVNPTTGSVVLQYDTDKHHEFHGHLEQHHTGGHERPPTNEIDALAAKIEQEAEYLAEHSHTARVIVDYFKHFDEQIKLATGNVVDLKIVLALGIAGFTIFEIGASAATPVWVTIAIFALNHMIQAGMNEAAARAAEDDLEEEEEILAPA
jgi:peptidoglycan/xylan/chitin deacetylase (PgdA/CDA1 family)